MFVFVFQSNVYSHHKTREKRCHVNSTQKVTKLRVAKSFQLLVDLYQLGLDLLLGLYLQVL